MVNLLSPEKIEFLYQMPVLLQVQVNHMHLFVQQELVGIDNQQLYSDYLLHVQCPRGVMVKAMHCGIVVREFVLQSRYYVHFRANTLGKGMNPLILPPAMGK